MSVFVSVLTLMSISVERYLAICYPLWHHGAYMKTRLVIAGIWIVSLLTAAVELYNMELVHEPQVCVIKEIMNINGTINTIVTTVIVIINITDITISPPPSNIGWIEMILSVCSSVHPSVCPLSNG